MVEDTKIVFENRGVNNQKLRQGMLKHHLILYLAHFPYVLKHDLNLPHIPLHITVFHALKCSSLILACIV